ncbi:unnamed protein product, partial [Didymodactylos carnosus]
GLIDHPKRDMFVEQCFNTVATIQQIPYLYGKCVRNNNTFNKKCINALVKAIKHCMVVLGELPGNQNQFYCGYTIMKYCYEDVGLERKHLLKFNSSLKKKPS